MKNYIGAVFILGTLVGCVEPVEPTQKPRLNQPQARAVASVSCTFSTRIRLDPDASLAAIYDAISARNISGRQAVARAIAYEARPNPSPQQAEYIAAIRACLA